MIKLLAFDLDGTLLTSNQLIDEETLAEIKNTTNAKYIICTGRCHDFVKDIVKMYNLDCDLILNNGHEFYTSDLTEHICYGFDKNTLKEVVQIYMNNHCDMMLYGADGYKYTFTELDVLYNRSIDMSVKHNGFDIRKLPHSPFATKEKYLNDTKLLNSIDELDDIQILKIDGSNIDPTKGAKCVEELSALPNVDVSSSYSAFIEVCQSDMSKGAMLVKIANRYGINSDEIASFGDGDNDMSMMTAIKYSFAMGNAKEPLKASAKYTTDTNNNQGILKAIKMLKADKLL